MTISQWHWDFGDGNTSNVASPTHVYTDPGSYDVTLTTTNQVGSSHKTVPSAVVADPDVNAGQVVFDTAGTFMWTCPPDVFSVSVVCVGAGAHGRYEISGPNAHSIPGGGGGLSYKNNIPVVPGQQYEVIIGASSDSGTPNGGNVSFNGTSCSVEGGHFSVSGFASGLGGNPITGDGGGKGGDGGGNNFAFSRGSGAGGAGGYSGDGGKGGDDQALSGSTDPGADGQGGGGGGGGGIALGIYEGGGGGGVGLLGEGASGVGGVWVSPGNYGYKGTDGSKPANASTRTPSGGVYGGGSGGVNGNPGKGACRIIWPGTYRQFPSTNTGDM